MGTPPIEKYALNPADCIDVEELLLIGQLLDTPEDDTLRFAYADWCRERDTRARRLQADYLRAVRRHKFVRAVGVRGWWALLGPGVGRVTIPDVLERFAMYYDRVGSAWGGLHNILADGNVDDDSVRWCRDEAKARGEIATVKLCEPLLQMTRTQRAKLPVVVREVWLEFGSTEFHPVRVVTTDQMRERCLNYSKWRHSRRKRETR